MINLSLKFLKLKKEILAKKIKMLHLNSVNKIIARLCSKLINYTIFFFNIYSKISYSGVRCNIFQIMKEISVI